MGRLRDAWNALRGSAALVTPASASDRPERPALHISEGAMADVVASYGAPLKPWTLPKLPDFVPSGARMAMDSAASVASDVYAWAAAGAFSEGLGFLGYAYLSELSQRPEYRRVSEIWASEATRKWVKLTGTPERVTVLEEAMKKHGIRELFREVSEQDGFFGRSQIFIDLGDDMNSAELSKPLLAAAKIKKNGIRGFKAIEPFWSYPGQYESNNPLAPDFYRPQTWYVMAATVHHTRLLTIVGREMPDMLKPAYSFGGLSLSQMIKPYVDNWLRTRQSVSDLIHSFSTMVLATDMAQVLGGGAAGGLIKRLQLFNQTRDNRGVFAINKESEELQNISTPLGTLDELQAQSQEQIASVSGIPLVILLGVTPSGLNASSDGEVRTFYATIKAYQERVFRKPLTKIIELVQLDLDGKIDPDIGFEFIDLWEVPEAEKAAARKSDADIDVAYIGAGVVDAEEVRARVTKDEESPYFGMDLDKTDAPEPPTLEDDEEGDAEEGLPPDPDVDEPGKQDATSRPTAPRGAKPKAANDKAPGARAAGVACVTPKGRVLLMRRSARASDHPGTWAFPGGAIEDGEDDAAAAARELFEEAGYELGDVGLDSVGEFPAGFALYRALVGADYDCALNDEHDKFGWFGADELPQPLHPGVAEAVSAALAGVAMDAEFEENKHPRAANGKFGSGGGGAAAKPVTKPTGAPEAKPTHAKVASILGDDGVAHLRELVADKSSKAADVLAALKPLDDAQRDMTPTLPHGQEPDQDYWSSRTYHADGKDMDAADAKAHLESVAAAYAGEGGVKQDRQARILLGPPAAGKATMRKRSFPNLTAASARRRCTKKARTCPTRS